MRGKVVMYIAARRVAGITPAHAGKRMNGSLKAKVVWDHPRACGEKGPAGRVQESGQGSPPRMRGKDGLSVLSVSPLRDHPRACGEKLIQAVQSDTGLGSPPRMRGKVLDLLVVSLVVGITPAHAGKRRTPAGHRSTTQDHPRACGEKAYINAAMDSGVGSPPRMRGKANEVVLCFLPGGITPAHAGKSAMKAP